jgi:hypothetical protein
VGAPLNFIVRDEALIEKLDIDDWLFLDGLMLED